MQPDILAARAMSGRNAVYTLAAGVPGARAHQLDTARPAGLTLWAMAESG